MAVYTTTSIGGFGLGQLVLLGFDLETLAPFAVAAALTSLATLPVLSVPSTDPALPEIDPIHTPDAGRLAPVGVGTGITAGVTWGVIAGMGAVFAARHGLDADEASAFVGAAVLGGLVLQWPVGAVSDRVDRRSVVTAIGAVAVVVACAGVVLDDRLGFAALLLFGAALGALAMPLYPLSLSITLERAAPGHLLDTSATLVQLNGIGSMIGPLVAAAGLAVAGSRGFFLVLAVTFLANTLVAAGTRIADGARLPRRPFVPAPPRISGLTAAVASAWRRRPPSPPPW